MAETMIPTALAPILSLDPAHKRLYGRDL